MPTDIISLFVESGDETHAESLQLIKSLCAGAFPQFIMIQVVASARIRVVEAARVTESMSP